MKNTAPDGKKNSLWGYLTLLCGIAGMVFVLAMTFLAVKDMGAVYRTFAEADLSQDFSDTLSYDDKLYAMMGCGIEIPTAEADKRERMDAFLDDTLRQIDYRISAAGLLYAMMIGVAPALFLRERYGDRKGGHTLASALAPAAAWLVFLLAQALLRAAFRVPIKVPAGKELFTLCVSLFSVCGGCCALGWLLRRVRFRKIAAFAAIPLAFALLVTGMLAEGGLFCSPETESFDYLFEAQPEGYENAVYDEAKNAVVINGEEYPPEIAPNPDHFTGIAAVGAAAYEAVNPFGGSGVAMVGQFDGTAIPGWILPLYLCKAVCWIALPAALPFKKKQTASAEEEPEG